MRNNIIRDFVAGRTMASRLRNELWLTRSPPGLTGYLRVPF